MSFLALCRLAAEGASLSYEGLADLRGPYDGTDWLGHAFYTIRLGEAGRLPVYACWSSAAGVSSPWLGCGWSLPLVESRVFPIGERTLELHLPDGYVRYFHKGRDGRFVGGRYWVADRKEDDVRVTADSKDGLPKSVFVFVRGRLVRMECEEGVYEFRHDARNGDSVISHGKTVLSVRTDPGDPNIVRLEVGGSRITVQKGVGSRLVELSLADGTRRTFSYGDEGGRGLFETEGETLMWDAESRALVSRNGCRFSVGRRPNSASGPKIERIDAAGNVESYFHDVLKGVTEETFPDGRKVITRRFTSGDNMGRVRRKEMLVGGVMQKRVDYIYDVDGSVRDKLVRTE